MKGEWWNFVYQNDCCTLWFTYRMMKQKGRMEIQFNENC